MDLYLDLTLAYWPGHDCNNVSSKIIRLNIYLPIVKRPKHIAV